MMSKAMHHVHHWFRPSPNFLSFALGVVDLDLHVKQACIELYQQSNSWMWPKAELVNRLAT